MHGIEYLQFGEFAVNALNISQDNNFVYFPSQVHWQTAMHLCCLSWLSIFHILKVSHELKLLDLHPLSMFGH